MLDVRTGLWLEDRALRLAWDSLLETLREQSKPDVCTVSRDMPPVTTLVWNDHVWGGLPCQVTTRFGGECPQASLRGIRLVIKCPDNIRRCPEGFRWVQAKLVERGGPPASFRDDGEQGEAFWHVDGSAIRHEYLDSMGGGHYVFVFKSEEVG